MTTIDIVRENFKARTEIQGELRQIDEAATADKRDYTDAERATIDEKRSVLQAIDDRIVANLEMEARGEAINDGLTRFLGAIADRETGEVTDSRSIGERFVSDEYRNWANAGARGRFDVALDGLDVRAVTDVTTGATSAGALGVPQRLARIGQDFLDRRTFLVDLIPHINTTTGAVEYVQDKTPLADIADKPVEVTEGSAKPQAGPTFEVVTEPMATVAAWVNMTRQAAADYPQVQSYLDTRLRYALKRRLDKQFIGGDGISPNMTGLLNRSGITTNAPGSTEAWYKTVRHAITVMELVETVPEIIVWNPADAEIFDLTNDTTAGLHAVIDVAGQGARTAWGLTQVRSTAVTAGTALLIDPMAVALFDRQAPTAYMTDSHASNFTSNILTLLLELRAGTALFDPKGVCKITFND